MEFHQKGTLFTKDKIKKLDYYKKGSSFEIDVYQLVEEIKEGNITKRGYCRSNNFKLIMNKNSFINYLKTELYV